MSLAPHVLERTLQQREDRRAATQRLPAADRTDRAAVPVAVIEPPSRWPSLNLLELWRYRDMFLLLVRRDLAARYRQSIVGYGWAVIKPVLSMIIFTVIFGRVAQIPSDGSPYALFAFTALLPWTYFSGALTGATSSVVGGSGLLTKVYFPRLILPLVSITVGLVDLAIQSTVLAGLMVWYGVALGPRLLALPAFVLMALLTALAAGVWLTALNVRFRDVGHAVPFFTQAWMWLSPIVYSSSAIPEPWRPLYGLNPLTGVIEGFRWSILGTTTPDWTMVGVSFAVVALLLVSGLYHFRKLETTFADVI
jgi:lipopolysaccharide transport system permease protein